MTTPTGHLPPEAAEQVRNAAMVLRGVLLSEDVSDLAYHDLIERTKTEGGSVEHALGRVVGGYVALSMLLVAALAKVKKLSPIEVLDALDEEE